ncbi:MAG: peptidoglycan DD-metalloendopeptidase family protein [Acidobacteria bacterium]|nr:peptidoglycan DD-metalloendopeptidase family protein [Acidobacteriota bacterium]
MNNKFQRKSSSARRRCFYLAGSFAVALFLPPFSSAGRADDAKSAEITLVHKERSLQPGEAVLVEMQSSQPLQNLHVEAFGRQFPAFPENGKMVWTGILGIDLEIKPGRYAMTVKGAASDGSSVTARKYLQIIGKKFPARHLSVDEKFVSPGKKALARIEAERKKVNAIFASVTPEKIWSGRFEPPVPGKVISEFGKRSIYNGKPRSPHSGVDLKGATGTPIRAPNAARVVLAEDLYYSGNTIILDHGLGLFSYLAHLSEYLVKEGDRVKPGDLIGKVGATGRVTGPHLHWTVRLIGTRVDPLSLIEILGERE